MKSCTPLSAVFLSSVDSEIFKKAQSLDFEFSKRSKKSCMCAKNKNEISCIVGSAKLKDVWIWA
jgi:hypothetical protein